VAKTPRPLIFGPRAREVIAEIIDARIAGYQRQRDTARAPLERKLGTMLIDECLDLRNELLGVPSKTKI
jgi:hypothetical protein